MSTAVWSTAADSAECHSRFACCPLSKCTRPLETCVFSYPIDLCTLTHDGHSLVSLSHGQHYHCAANSGLSVLTYAKASRRLKIYNCTLHGEGGDVKSGGVSGSNYTHHLYLVTSSLAELP
jgi:hypothetical protein